MTRQGSVEKHFGRPFDASGLSYRTGTTNATRSHKHGCCVIQRVAILRACALSYHRPGPLASPSQTAEPAAARAATCAAAPHRFPLRSGDESANESDDAEATVAPSQTLQDTRADRDTESPGNG